MHIMVPNEISPTVSNPIFNGEVTVVGYGVQKKYPYFNWSLSQMHTSFDSHLEKNNTLLTRLREVFWHHKLDIAYGPNPSGFNGLIASNDQFAVRGSIPIYWKDNRASRLLRGVHADGIELEKPDRSHPSRNAFMMSSGDCALIVVKSDDRIFTAHAGRKSLIDFKRNNGQHSIVDEIVYMLTSEQRKKLQVWIGFSVSAGPHFSHRRNDKRHPDNGRLIDYITDKYGTSCFLDNDESNNQGWLDIKELIAQQFEFIGAKRENITKDSICTNNDVDESDNHVWFSQTRNPDLKERNLVFAIRNVL
jgi:copper oxidase (laccase) domain-containing protein